MSKKKICIVTWYKSTNYGTMLQAYALFKKIESMGYSCFILEYSGKTLLRRILSYTKQLIKRSFFFNIDTVSKYGASKQKMERIENFVLNDLHIVKLKRNYFKMRKLENETSFFVTGSDQIWNPYHLELNGTFMLSMVKNKNKKVAYASSLGISKLPENRIKYYKKYLASFKYLSSREDIGTKILSSELDRKVYRVLDPTFLLTKEDWRNFSKDSEMDPIIMNEPYILCYFVGNFSHYWEDVFRIKSETGIENIVVIPLKENHYIADVLLIDDAGPKEFISLIENANLVCTDSFHATALSINFQKDFIEFLRFDDNKSDSQNSRIKELLGDYGLESRFYKKSKIPTDSIDYSKVVPLLEKEKDFSNNFLSQCFKDENDGDL